ncbi:MAG: adenosylmethionine--8-amino-7-oxononanoate transaminase [Bernardetiaceae bacterium]|nr:adenosylmethionine--8-amino-7-oxononanoate transaminase [Bernardetiaceae bacterium]
MDTTQLGLQARDTASVWHPFTPLGEQYTPLPIVRGQGAYLFTADGRKILDAVSSWWVNLHGHSHPYLAKALAEQAAILPHVIFAGFTHEPAIRLSERLLSLLGGDFKSVFFSDNGSTAIEVALKMAMQYFDNQNNTTKKKRHKIIAFEGAYHGDTFGAMSVGARSAFNAPFSPFLFEVEFLDLPNATNIKRLCEQMQNYVNEGESLAFIFEPLIQGAGGMNMYEPQYLNQLLAIAKTDDMVCIADEIMTGFYRTGTLFAIEQLEHKPDIICLSKGITGGTLPLSVSIANRRIKSAFEDVPYAKSFLHGHSYTANTMACAVANASLDLLLQSETQMRISKIVEKIQNLSQKFKALAFIENVRYRGTVIALDIRTQGETSYFNSMRDRLYQYFINRDILLRPLGNTLYIMPPYIMDLNDLDRIYQAIEVLPEHVDLK